MTDLAKLIRELGAKATDRPWIDRGTYIGSESGFVCADFDFLTLDKEFIVLLANNADEIGSRLDELARIKEAASREIRCSCHEAYTTRKMDDPDCLAHSRCIDTYHELKGESDE